MHHDIQERHTIKSIYQIKCIYLQQIKELEKLDDEIKSNMEHLNGFEPYRIEYRFGITGEDRHVKYIDRACWKYLIDLFELQKYMLCTDYDNLINQVYYKFEFPEYTIENAYGWMESLRDVIYDNVRTLVKTVFERATTECYYTGSGYSNRKKKKRNNNGIDEKFILTTHEHSDIFGYRIEQTFTDDLEKACFLLDGKQLPKYTLKDCMRKERMSEHGNDYFDVKIHKNGNTHYHIHNKEILNKLNIYGSESAIIGEDIKIKILETRRPAGG